MLVLVLELYVALNFGVLFVLFYSNLLEILFTTGLKSVPTSKLVMTTQGVTLSLCSLRYFKYVIFHSLDKASFIKRV